MFLLTATRIAVLFAVGTSAALASTSVTFSYAANDPNNSNEPANATATFVWSGTGVLTVTLQNYVTNEGDVGQAISGLKFTLVGLTNASSTESGSGDLIP